MSNNDVSIPECARLTMWAMLAHGLRLDHSNAHAILHFMYRDPRVVELGFVENGDFASKNPDLYVKVFEKTLKRLRKVKGDCKKLDKKMRRKAAKAKKHALAAAEAVLTKVGAKGVTP